MSITCFLVVENVSISGFLFSFSVEMGSKLIFLLAENENGTFELYKWGTKINMKKIFFFLFLFFVFF
jgi:hypothetical protein